MTLLVKTDISVSAKTCKFKTTWDKIVSNFWHGFCFYYIKIDRTDIYCSKKDIHYNIIGSKNFEEIKMKEEKPRGNVRVDDILKVDYRKISPEYYKRYENKPEVIFNNIFGEPDKIPEIEEVNLKLLYKLIYQTNLKIDRLLSMLEDKDTQRHASVNSECVNISGSGMKFAANHHFLIGNIIALRVFLPLDMVSGSWINVLGKVMSVAESESENRYTTAVKFIDLPEDDREIIIRYVFKRQRELLRLDSEIKTENQDLTMRNQATATSIH